MPHVRQPTLRFDLDFSNVKVQRLFVDKNQFSFQKRVEASYSDYGLKNYKSCSNEVEFHRTV